MKNKFIATSLMLFLFNPLTAFAATVKCPSVAELQKVKFTETARIPNGKWAAVQINNTYDTDRTWDMVVGAVDADNADEASNKLTSSMNNLTLIEGPVGDEESGYGCLYTSEENVHAVAVSPSRFEMEKLLRLLGK